MPSAETIETKSAFAKRCNVSPGRVSQWISEGLISPDALVGEGRTARIRVETALAQVNVRRDVGQSLGNGLDTKLEPPPECPDETAEQPPSPGSAALRITAAAGSGDVVSEQLKRERLFKLQAENRKLAEEEAARAGLYTETAEVRAQMGRIAGTIVRIFEGALPEIATGLAAAFKLDARDVAHQLGEQFRKAREKASEAAAQAAAVMPDRVQHELVAPE